MARATMYQEPLERYLLTKINSTAPIKIDGVHIRRLNADQDDCNWDLAATQPPLPLDLAAELNRKVILPIRNAINLVD